MPEECKCVSRIVCIRVSHKQVWGDGNEKSIGGGGPSG